jgi:hypothetical protein
MWEEQLSLILAYTVGLVKPGGRVLWNLWKISILIGVPKIMFARPSKVNKQ